MQENLREFSKKTVNAVKTALAKLPGGIAPVVMLLSVGIIALTQESPFQIDDFTEYNAEGEEGEEDQGAFFIYEPQREIPEWVKPARWFRSNSGGMPLEEMKSSIAAMRGKYALVIDFTSSPDLPEFLLDFYDERFFIEFRTLFKNGKEDRTQWIFRDEDFGVRLIAVLFEPAQPTAQEADTENIDSVSVEEEAVYEEAAVMQNTEGENIEIAQAQAQAPDDDDIEDEEQAAEVKVKKDRKPFPAGGFIEVYDEKYHITEEYRYTEKGEISKIEYFYSENIKISAKALVWDDDEDDYIQTHTDYYRYNRSSFLRAVERVFLKDRQINDDGFADNVVTASFPQNILAAARNSLFMGERINSYPDFFGDLFVSKDSKIVFTTDDKGRVLDQTLIGNDEEKTVIWKIVNTWEDDRIVKVTKTEGETVLLAEYVYNREGDRVLERNIKDGVLERVVRTEGKKDIEELYLDDKLVLQAVWEDGRKISESRINKN
jgi:hypothetical protein